MGSSRAAEGDLRRLVDGSAVQHGYDEVHAKLRAFVEERAWDAFHSPKDLAMSIAIEAGELLEVFQWRDLQAGDITPGDQRRMADELADVTMYVMLLADKAGIDLWAAVEQKLAENARKYPVERARGRADKYDRL